MPLPLEINLEDCEFEFYRDINLLIPCGLHSQYSLAIWFEFFVDLDWIRNSSNITVSLHKKVIGWMHYIDEIFAIYLDNTHYIMYLAFVISFDSFIFF